MPKFINVYLNKTLDIFLSSKCLINHQVIAPQIMEAKRFPDRNIEIVPTAKLKAIVDMIKKMKNIKTNSRTVWFCFFIFEAPNDIEKFSVYDAVQSVLYFIQLLTCVNLLCTLLFLLMEGITDATAFCINSCSM